MMKRSNEQESFCRSWVLGILAAGALSASSGAAAPRVPAAQFSLESICENEARIRVELPPGSCRRSSPWLIAFSTLPGKDFSATASVDGGVRFSLESLASGRCGADYLQWCSLAPGNIPCRDSTISCSISIRFSEPLYLGIRMEQVSFGNRILRVPLGQFLRKAQAVSRPLPFTHGLRMEVDRDGIYELSAAMLGEYGVPVDRIPSRTYRLFEQDREIPIYLTNEHHATLGGDDCILFYGQQLRASSRRFEQFSASNVYWLTWGDRVGARVAVVSGGRRVDPTVYTATSGVIARNYYDSVHIEEDNSIVWLGNVADRPPEEITGLPSAADVDFDNWYWGVIGAAALTTFTFPLQSPALRGGARIRMGLMGLSSIDSIAYDHQLEIFINNKPAGLRNHAIWDGQRRFVFESDTFSSDNLRHGKNDLTIKCSPLFADRSALNWIEIVYLRGYESLDDQARFVSDAKTAGSTVEYSVTGFSSDRIELWDVVNYRFFINTIIEQGSGKARGSRTLIFQDSIKTTTAYLAQTIDKRLVPRFLALDTIRGDWSALDGVDYIAVGPDSFRSDLEPLLRAHSERGLRTAFVCIDDIYKSFSYGIRNPESIRLFLKHLFSRLSGKPPRYLLLGGDTTHDLDKKNLHRNIVPTHLSRISGWGPGADDGYFATVDDGDLFADLSVGRFPARNRAEMRQLADRTMRYILKPCRGYWRDNLLMLGGGEPVFTQFNDETVAEIIGDRMNVVRMDADPESRFYKDGFVAPQLIAGHLNTGVFMVNFNGHGGGNIWSDNNFFGYNDLPLLHNGRWGGGGRLPVIFSFTCLTGFFESSEYRSLGEEFLRSGDNGAIAFYGASAYTSRSGNLILNKILLEEALGGAWNRLGDLIDYCELSLLVRYGTQYLDLVRQYNLLGDPALPWALTPDTLALTESFTDSNSVLAVSGVCSPVRDGEVKLSITSGNGPWNQTIVKAKDGTFSGSFRLKEGMKSTLATLRAYAWNDSAEVRGWKPLVKDTLLIRDVRLDPAHPYLGDSVAVSCELATPSGQSQPQILCLYALAPLNDPRVSFEGMEMALGSGGRWFTINKIPLPFATSVNDRLLLRFRVLASGRALQSPVFNFPVYGRSDLVFIDKELRIVWSGDSLRIAAEVLNKGNAPSAPFTVAFLWTRADMPPDTFALLNADSLASGKRCRVSAALSDTQGDLSFFAQILPGPGAAEIGSENNRAGGHMRILYRDMISPADTMQNDDWLIRLVPANRFEQKRRVFLFEDTIALSQPIATPSKWISMRETPPSKWYLTSRPALSGGDSLLWLWNTASENWLPFADSMYYKSGFMLYDTAIAQWRFFAGTGRKPTENPAIISMATALQGPFSLASIADAAPPEIMISVYGKTLERLDYTAKNRPFTIFLSDPSGILPQSIGLFCNNRPLPASAHAAIPSAGDLRSITISAYPEPQQQIDSLRVECMDLAGNHASRTFAYLPGSDLTIRSFSCHPNPFTARRNSSGTIVKIRFAFLLTDVASTATLSIYTVSGKKIRTWSLFDIIGYRQVEWDGRDYEGYRIANGTYYAKLIARNDRKKVHKIIRIAKLEGF